MEIKFDNNNVEHVARHLAGSSVLGGKFNAKISDSKQLLSVLAEYIKDKINPGNLFWIPNDISGTDTVEVPFKADADLKRVLGLSADEPLGYDGVIKITDDLRSRVVQKFRGKGEDQIEVNVIENISLESIDDFVVELKKRPGKEEIFIATAYPGTPGPNFPNKETQTDKAYQESKAYWNQYAFIK